MSDRTTAPRPDSREPDAAELDEVAALAFRIATEAGELIAERRRTRRVSVAATKSTDTDVVTAVDNESEALLRERIIAARPDDTIVGEEGDDRSGRSGWHWFLDPIDGTVNYLYDQPAYAVSVGVAYTGGAKPVDDVLGATVAGVVAAPGLGTMFSAVRGRGAFRDDQRLEVSDCSDLGQCLLGTGFGYRAERRRNQGRVVSHLIGQVRDLRRCGAAAIDLCFVAGGQLDAYYERGLNPWDYCAGGLIALEAGAVVTGLDAPATPEMVVAATPAIHPALVEALTGTDPLHD